jgi:hypothetical protein
MKRMLQVCLLAGAFPFLAAIANPGSSVGRSPAAVSQIGEKPRYEPKDDQERAAIEAFNSAAAVALGVHFRSRVLVVVLTAAWFLLFITVYAWIKSHCRRGQPSVRK